MLAYGVGLHRLSNDISNVHFKELESLTKPTDLQHDEFARIKDLLAEVDPVYFWTDLMPGDACQDAILGVMRTLTSDPIYSW